MVLIARAIGWVLYVLGGLADLFVIIASSIGVAAEYGLFWVILGWIFFPIGFIALPIAAGLWLPMLVAIAITAVGNFLAHLGE